MSSIQFGKFEFDSAKNIRETETEIIVPAILDRESILQYGNIRGYRSAKELQAAAFTLEGAWIVAYRHTPTPYIVDRGDVRGRVRSVSWDAEANALVGELHFAKSLCDAVLLEQVRKGTLSKDTSSAYFCKDVFEAGEFGGQKYDARQENLMYHHVAVGIIEGRCPSPYCGIMDSFSDFVRVSVRPQQLFSRLTTVLVSAKDGVYALVGKLRQGTKETVTSELMFDAEKGWTQERAEAWVKEHKNSVGVLNTEETEDFVHVRVRDPDLFVDGSFRTIDVDAEKGITAVVGKLKSDPDGAMVVQKYVFAKEKDWTMEKASAWVKEHKDSVPSQGQPKTDRERFMAHFGITAEAFQKLYDILGDELFKLLPDRGQKIQHIESETKDSALSLDPFEVLAQSRRLLSSR